MYTHFFKLIIGGSNSTSLVDWVYDNTVDGSSVGACPYLTSLGLYPLITPKKSIFVKMWPIIMIYKFIINLLFFSLVGEFSNYFQRNEHKIYSCL